MQILISDQNSERCRKVIGRINLIPEIAVTKICADLTSTFNEVEHRPPSLVLVAPELIKKPEFETMEMLFRSLKVRWMTYSIETSNNARLTMRSHDKPSQFINFSEELTEVKKALKLGGGYSNGSRIGASAGLFRSTAVNSPGQLILIGSSTGGVDALLHVLGSFPADCPATLVVQHTGFGFSKGLARLLDRNVEPVVKEAVEGEVPSRGQVLIAPSSDKHLFLNTGEKNYCSLVASPKVSGHRPSVDGLFRSCIPVAKQVTAAILTGMGRDGAEGMLELRKAGARTIGQDEATSVVYGMPGAAAQLGAVEKSLPLSAIGAALLRSPAKVAL